MSKLLLNGISGPTRNDSLVHALRKLPLIEHLWKFCRLIGACTFGPARGPYADLQPQPPRDFLKASLEAAVDDRRSMSL